LQALTYWTPARRVEITDTCRVWLSPDAGPILSCSMTSAPDHRSTDKHPSAVMRLHATKVIRIGRSEGNEIVVKDLRVSCHDAELRRAQGKYEIGHGRREMRCRSPRRPARGRSPRPSPA
jgi:hypothetical protein